MAKISQTSITLELETLSCDEVGNGIVMLDITVEEARELMNLLNERFDADKPIGGPLQYPEGVRTLGDPWGQTPIRHTGVEKSKKIT